MFGLCLLVPCRAHAQSIEEEIFKEINKVRTDPAAYANWMQANKNALPLSPSMMQPSTVNEAIQVLKTTSPLPALIYSEGIYKAAKEHVKNQLSSPSFSHIGTDGSNPITRMKRHGVFKFPGYENGSVMPSATARSIVLAWLIDNSSPERLHRAAILHTKIRFTAAACGTYDASVKAKGAVLCVADFAADFQEKP
jgi:uncharacterized protein YkwD